MAIIKNFKEIENLIPVPDYRLYGSNITEAPSREVVNNPLYGFIVNEKYKRVLSISRIMFMLVKRSNKYLLMIINYNGGDSFYTEYITLPDSKKIEKSDWKFSIDEFGLRMDSESYDKHIIYFGTLAKDADFLKKFLKNKKEHEVLTVETVVV